MGMMRVTDRFRGRIRCHFYRRAAPSRRSSAATRLDLTDCDMHGGGGGGSKAAGLNDRRQDLDVTESEHRALRSKLRACRYPVGSFASPAAAASGSAFGKNNCCPSMVNAAMAA